MALSTATSMLLIITMNQLASYYAASIIIMVTKESMLMKVQISESLTIMIKLDLIILVVINFIFTLNIRNYTLSIREYISPLGASRNNYEYS